MKWELIQDIVEDWFLILTDKNGNEIMMKITEEEAEVIKESLDVEVFRIPF